MNLALRPYVTTGVAIVGASVIAVAPITPAPPDIQVPNPAVQVERAVRLAATFEETLNSLIFQATALGLAVTVPPTAALIDAVGLVPEEPATATAEAAATVLLLGLAGPLISGPGSIGTAIQNIIDADGLDNILLAILLGAPMTIIDGFVNGGYGPDLGPLVLDSLADLDPALAQGLAVLALLGRRSPPS